MPASAANRPLSMYSTTVTIRTSMPARNAARALLPVAYTRRPNVVHDNTNDTSTTMPSQRNRSAGTPSTSLRTAERTAGGAYDAHAPQVRPLLRPSVSPSMTPFIPSVITTAGTARYAAPRPFTRPTANPSPSVSATADSARPSRPSEVVTNRIAAPLITHGTDRSMPPISTTNVWPAATKPTNEAMTRIASMLWRLAKPGLSMPPTTNTSTAAANA